MNSTHNIYRQSHGVALVWVDRVNGLREAEERVIHLQEQTPGSYLIFDVRERTVVRSAHA